MNKTGSPDFSDGGQGLAGNRSAPIFVPIMFLYSMLRNMACRDGNLMVAEDFDGRLPDGL